jgi:isocitrate dehydrogenase kinase/phosphatase
MPDSRRTEMMSGCARAIFEAFVRYNDNFRRITRRARDRFESRDWRGHQDDLAERIDLYTKSVDRMVAGLRRELGPRVTDRALWHQIKLYFGNRIETFPDAAFAKTFFSSVTRRIFDTVGVDPEIEFVNLDLEATTHLDPPVESKTYIDWGDPEEVFERVLSDFAFDVPYADQIRSVAFVTGEVQRYARAHPRDGNPVLRVEFIKPIFFQSSRAYLVGKAYAERWTAPLIISLKNGPDGIDVDDVIMSEDEVSIIFSFTRSYFFVDLETVGSAVGFLKSILPRKPIDELYTVLGRLRQGKTERYRIFRRHLQHTRDCFVKAPGDDGLVMLVFTLPSYDLVFKIIRDRFGEPKNTAREQVMRKYQLVFKHDRAGRLIDTQEFLHLQIPRARFSPELLEEFHDKCSRTVHCTHDMVVIDHLYIERRLRPLNLYLRDVDRGAAELAVLDYGQAIKDLALTNIFPGDLLLKNFGVTRHGRVIFYDYDELCLVTDCNFRNLPRAREDEEELRADPWFYVAENDVFPEQFIPFLAMDAGLKRLFLEVHADILTAEYWRTVKAQHQAEEIPDVLPYHRPVVPATRGDALEEVESLR